MKKLLLTLIIGIMLLGTTQAHAAHYRYAGPRYAQPYRYSYNPYYYRPVRYQQRPYYYGTYYSPYYYRRSPYYGRRYWNGWCWV